MTVSLSDLIAKKHALERQIREARERSKAEAIERVRQIMNDHGLTAADIDAHQKKAGSRAGARIAPKYRDSETGATWSGRGLKPKWVELAIAGGKSLADLAI